MIYTVQVNTGMLHLQDKHCYDYSSELIGVFLHNLHDAKMFAQAHSRECPEATPAEWLHYGGWERERAPGKVEAQWTQGRYLILEWPTA